MAGTLAKARQQSSLKSNMLHSTGSRPQTGFTRDALGSANATRLGQIDHANADDSNISQTWLGVGMKYEDQHANSFTVYEDKDNRATGIINFLSKVGSIQDLQQRESSPNQA